MNALDAPILVIADKLRPGDGHCIECGVPEMAQHLDSCPSAPIWAAMCAEQGNPLHLWAFGDMGSFLLAGTGDMEWPQWTLYPPGGWDGPSIGLFQQVPESRWNLPHGTLIFDTEPRDRSGLEGRSLLNLLDDANVAINYQLSAIDPCQREVLDAWVDAEKWDQCVERRRDWRAIWRRILWGTEGR